MTTPSLLVIGWLHRSARPQWVGELTCDGFPGHGLLPPPQSYLKVTGEAR